MNKEFTDCIPAELLNDFKIGRVVYEVKNDCIRQYNEEPHPFSLPIFNYAKNVISHGYAPVQEEKIFKDFFKQLKTGVAKCSSGFRIRTKQLYFHFFEVTAYKLNDDLNYVVYFKDIDLSMDEGLLKDGSESRFEKATLEFALKQSAINYFEFDFLTNDIHLSKYNFRLFWT